MASLNAGAACRLLFVCVTANGCNKTNNIFLLLLLPGEQLSTGEQCEQCEQAAPQLGSGDLTTVAGYHQIRGQWTQAYIQKTLM